MPGFSPIDNGHEGFTLSGRRLWRPVAEVRDHRRMPVRTLGAAIVWCVLVTSTGCPSPAPPAPVVSPVVRDEVLVVEKVAPPPPVALPPAVIDVGDLAAIKGRGTLRILVYGRGEDLLPRAGASMNAGEETAVLIARHLGLEPELISVDRFADLIPMLLEGKGDMVAARMSVTAARRGQVAFSRPVSSVDELLIVSKKEPLPTTLKGFTSPITVRASSAYRETLDEQKAKVEPALVLADADESKDTVTLLHDVASGAIAATVADSDIVDHVAAYESGFVAAFPLRKNREIAFALRPTNPALKTAVDAWLVEKNLTSARGRLRKVDFDTIKKRGSLRVLTRNNGVSYFLYKGIQQGFDYDIVSLFAAQHGLRIEVVVPPNASDLIPWLLEGHGDVIAAGMTVTPERQRQVWFSPPYNVIDEVVVQRSSEAPIRSLDGLAGKTFHVRPSSSYRQTLNGLVAAHGPFSIVDAAEDVETEDLIAGVASGSVAATVADSSIAAVEKAWRTDIQLTQVLATGREVALAVRPDAPKLQAALEAFVKSQVHRDDVDGRLRGSTAYNVLKRQYFESSRRAQESATSFKSTGQLSAYDAIIQETSSAHGLDWRLMAAQAYQESRFDPGAKSWVGALGLFQVMPRTGAEMGFKNLADPVEGTHAGVRYMAQLIDSFDKRIPFKERVRFALASYNAGRGHVEDARRLAGEMGLNGDTWFRHVEQAMLRLEDPKVHRRTRHGYCRGSEPVKYVSEISLRYSNYVGIVPNPGAVLPPSSP